MKKLLKNLITKLSNDQSEILNKEIKESTGFEGSHHACSAFTTVDLWNIQRQTKTRPQRRFL